MIIESQKWAIDIYDELSDIDGLDLFSKLNVLREFVQSKTNNPIDQLHIKKIKFFSKCMYRL